MAGFSEKKKLLNTKCVFWFLHSFYLKRFPFQEEFSEILPRMSKRLHVKYSLFLTDFNESSVFSTDFRKNSDIKFHKNPPDGSRVATCGRTDGHDEANSFSNAHKHAFLTTTAASPVSTTGTATISACSWSRSMAGNKHRQLPACVLIRREAMIVQLVWVLISAICCVGNYKGLNYERQRD